MSGIVITAYHRGRRRLLWSALIAGAIVAACGAYGVGQYRAANAELVAVAENAKLRREVETLGTEVSRLREHNAVLERTSQVERETYQKLESSITHLQDQVAALKAEVAFYKTVVSPQDAVRGIRVGSFDASPVGGENAYRFKLVLTQVVSNDTVVEGEFSLTVVGLIEGAEKRLPLERIHARKSKTLPFSFKYFESLEGELSFPREFIPARVIVKVNPAGKKHEAFEETIEWPFEEGKHVG